MRFPILSTACAICFALPALAQEGTVKNPATKEAAAKKFQGMAFPGAHSVTTLAVFASDFSVGHMASISHGQPEWKPEHDAMIEKFKGTTQRLGKDAWTTLTTTTELELGGTKIPAGAYVVAIACGKDGTFSLSLCDSTKAMKGGLLPFGPQTWKPEFTVPMTLNKDSAKEVVEKMTMTFAADPSVVGKGSFTIAWGKHTLTTGAVLNIPAAK
jgi:hypothetical protein